MCADECQKTAFASSSSNLSSSSLADASNGRSRSQTAPSTLATTALSARPLLMPAATSYGVVSHDLPSTTLPSGRVTLMSLRSCLASHSARSALQRSQMASRSAM